MPIFLFFLTTISCFAHETAWDDIMRSKDVDSLIRAEDKINKRRRHLEFCNGERQGSKFPVYCLLQLQDWLGAHHNQNQLRLRWRQLSTHCARSEPDQVSQEQVTKLLAAGPMPKRCRNKLEVRLADLSYVSDANWSEF